MHQHKEYHEKPNINESSLESLQADLFKSKENYKDQANSLEQLTVAAKRLMQKSPNTLKAKPASITFKKSKYSEPINPQSQ